MYAYVITCIRVKIDWKTKKTTYFSVRCWDVQINSGEFDPKSVIPRRAKYLGINKQDQQVYFYHKRYPEMRCDSYVHFLVESKKI